MNNTLSIKLTSFIKLFTYIAGSVLLLSNDMNRSVATTLLYLIPVVLINSFSRDYLEVKLNNLNYSRISIVAELVLLLAIALVDKTGAFILFCFVTLSEATISFQVKFSGTVLFVISIIVGAHIYKANEIRNVINFIHQFLSYAAVSLSFTFVMSYLVRKQITERERIQKINGELEEAYRKLMESESKNKQLSIEKERTRMAREIHDTLGHTLTAIIVQTEACRRLMEANAGNAADELLKAQELAREGLNDVRRSIKALRPSALESGTVFDALHSLTDEINKTTFVKINISTNLNEEEAAKRLEQLPGATVAIYRVVQESITNAIRHGKAEAINICFTFGDGGLELYIQDVGVGCTAFKKGFGLTGITERISSIGGFVEFAGIKDRGFKTYVTIPLGRGVGQ